MRVQLADCDIDRHGAGCDCGICNSNGKSYGVAIYQASQETLINPDALNWQDPLEVIYGPSSEAAYHNARLEAQTQGWVVMQTED